MTGPSGNGGAVGSFAGTLTISNSTFSGNSAGKGAGGGIAQVAGGPLTIINSTFSGNSAADAAGAIQITDATTMVTNSTFSLNTSGGGAGTGGAIDQLGAGPITVTNSILAGGGTSGNCGGTLADGGDNISDEASCGFGTSIGANGKTIGDSVNPLLDPNGLQNNGGPTETIALQLGSPAIDAIPTGRANCPGFDQRGAPRPDVDSPAETSCDIGAFEYGTFLVTRATATASVTPTSSPTATAPVSAAPSRSATSTPSPAPSTSITFVGASSLVDSATPVGSINLAHPSEDVGDVMIAQIIIYDGAGTNVPTAPTGWSLIRDDVISSGNKITSWLYDKVVTGTEPANYTWTFSAQYAAGVMGVWRSTTSPSPVDQASGVGASGANPIDVAAPSLTPFTNGELQVYFYGSQNFVAPTITEPAAIATLSNDKSSKEGFTLAFGDLAAPNNGTASPT